MQNQTELDKKHRKHVWQFFQRENDMPRTPLMRQVLKYLMDVEHKKARTRSKTI